MEYVISKSNLKDLRDGTKENPFRDVQELFRNIKLDGDSPINFKILIENENQFKEISKAQLKKEVKIFKTNLKKAATTEVQISVTTETKDFEIIKLDSSIPSVRVDIIDLAKYRGQRVNIYGHVHHMREQSKKLWFLEVFDGTGILQCVLENKLCKTEDASKLTSGCSLQIFGKLQEVKEGSTAEGGHELLGDYWKLIGGAPRGGLESVLNKESDVDVQFDQRHLMLRGENTSRIMIMTDILLSAFRQHYRENRFRETILPAIVQSQCEGGSTLFSLKYFGEDAYLTQSSQLYLETMLPVVGKSYTIAKSFRAEKSRTRRHLSEYTHIEAEANFLTFDGLLTMIEDMLVRVSEIVLKLDKDTLLKVNPDYKPLKAPFRRMQYIDAIEFLRQNKIHKPEGTTYEFGDDIPEGAERAILSIIDEPLMLTRFPKEIKAFYMSVCEDDHRVTESVDVLLPGVGEVVGGSMRIWDYDELLAAYAREGLDPSPYYWYTDQRRFGTTPHGGYGLGFERLLTWMLKKEHIRDVCSYPRYMGRCTP